MLVKGGQKRIFAVTEPGLAGGRKVEASKVREATTAAEDGKMKVPEPIRDRSAVI